MTAPPRQGRQAELRADAAIVRRIKAGCAIPAPVPGEDVTDERRKPLERRIYDLQVEHRDLDEVVARLATGGGVDELLLTRLKKRKLQLKDEISRLRSLLIPDLDA